MPVMSRRHVAACALTLAALGPPACGSEPAPSTPVPAWTLLLRHATIVDGDAPPRRATVAIEDDRIAGVFDETPSGTSLADAQRPALDTRTRVVDLSGQWLLPGYIDAHVHLLDSSSLFTSPDDYDLRRLVPHEEERDRIRRNLPATMRRYLCAGVTTAVSLGGPSWEITERNRLRLDPTTARIASAGPFFANFPVGEFTLWTRDDPVLIQIGSAGDVDRVLDDVSARGVDLVKIGVASYPGFNLRAFEPILTRFVEQAHAHRLQVAVHAEELELAKAVLRAGVDVLAHVVSDRLVDEEFLALARAKPIVVTSGISTIDSDARVLDGRMALLDIETRCGDPAAILSWSRLADIPERSRPPRPSAVVWGSSDEGRYILIENTRRLFRAGIAIAVGTNGGQIGTLHGASFHRELRALAEAGLTPAQLVKAATRNGALVLGSDANRGTIAVGALADLVVLTANPLEGVERLAAIGAVVRGGVYHPATALAAQSPNP